MTTPNSAGNNVEHSAASKLDYPLEIFISFALVLFAVAFNLIYLYPEVAGEVRDRNDMVLHLVMADVVVEALTQGQDFTDPWQGAMGMGFPLLLYYQHIPHIAIALAHVLTLEVFPLVDVLHWTNYLLLSLFPLSIYWSLRRFGFDRISSALGGLVSSLLTTNGIFGFSYRSYTFAGWGLYTQLWGMVLLPPTLAVSYRVLREGRGYFWATLLLAATLMSHLLYGYMAFLTLGIFTFIQPILMSNPKSFAEGTWKRWRRLIILFLLVVVVTSYFSVPLLLDLDYYDRGFWDPIKFGSWGHSTVLTGLVGGGIYDFDRFPSLTYLAFAGFVICLFRWREERYLIPVAIFLLWLLLYFGRPTWGPLIDLLPMSRYLHMHRFIGGVHLGGIFLMAVALAVPWRWALSRSSIWSTWYLSAALVLTVVVLLPVYRERISYLEDSGLFVKEHQRIGADAQNFSALLERLKQLPPGRVYAGLQTTADKYRVRNVHPYDLLHAEGLDMMGTYYQRFTLNSNVLSDFNEQRLDHYNLFNVRYVVAPEERSVPDFVKPIRQVGRHRLYQVETTGYFDLVGSDLTFAGGKTDFYPAASSWLASGLPGVKQHPVVYIGDPPQAIERPLPLSAAGDVISKSSSSAGPSRGAVLSEEIGNNYFAADVTVERGSMLLLKATYHPNWRATVDGIEADTVMVMPSFVGIQLSPGEHRVLLEYRPRRLRIILLTLGLLTLPLVAIGEKPAAAFCRWFATGVSSRISSKLRTPRSAIRRQSRRRRRHR